MTETKNTYHYSYSRRRISMEEMQRSTVLCSGWSKGSRWGSSALPYRSFSPGTPYYSHQMRILYYRMGNPLSDDRAVCDPVLSHIPSVSRISHPPQFHLGDHLFTDPLRGPDELFAYIVIWPLIFRSPNVLYLLLVLAVQILIITLWAYGKLISGTSATILPREDRTDL